jgi:hypothetical protein
MKITKDILSIYEEILTNNKNILSELELVKLNDTNYSNLNYDMDGTQYDSVNKALLDDINAAAKSAGITATITTASTGHPKETSTGSESRHTKKTAVDISILNSIDSGGATNDNNGNPHFKFYGNKLKNALVSMGYTLNKELGNDKAVFWQTNIGGNHFNHLHVSNNSKESENTPNKTSDETSDEKSDEKSNNNNDKKSIWDVTSVPEDTFMLKTVKSLADKFLNEKIERIKKLL